LSTQRQARCATSEAGQFDAEFEIEWDDGRKQTVPNRGYLKIYIDEDLG
jgi:hypothetical protein